MSTETQEKEASAALCVMNIGPRERLIRKRIGYGALLVSMASAGYMIWADLPYLMRIFWSIPLGVAIFSLAEAQQKTCIVHAAMGTRILENKREALPDSDRDSIRRQAIRVWVFSLVATWTLTTLFVLLPSIY